MEMDKRNPNFPSDFLSPEQKASKEYALLWSKAIDSVGLYGAENGLFPGVVNINNTSVSRYAERRAYARGMQPIDKYKPILGIRDKRMRRDPTAVSYRALNWEIVDVATKYVNVLLGKLMANNNDVGINAVDKKAHDARRKKRMELQENVLNSAFLQGVSQKTGIQFETPVQEDDSMGLPQTMQEVNVFMDMFYKEDYCLVMQDFMKLLGENDNYTDLLSEVGRDAIETGVLATKVYRVGNRILRRRCIPERMTISSTIKSLCDDVKFVSEDWDITIGQLKEICGDQFSEAEYRKISEIAAKQDFGSINIDQYYLQNLCYPWDNTKITVKDCVWFSPDWETYQVGQNQFGNVAVSQKEYSWWPNLTKKNPGLTVDQFNKVNESQVIRYHQDNQYQCLWIKGTEFVANYGKSKDMLKNQSNLGKCIGPYTIYKLKKCPVETIIPTLDNIQINFMQYQHHAAKTIPSGVAIEFTALQDISIAGAGGKALSPKEALQIYFETGTLLWRRRDAQGNLSNYKPVEQLAGSQTNAMEKHFAYAIQGINLLRDQLGLNELTDASTPNSEMGKAVATMAADSTNDALKPLFFAFDTVNIETQKRTIMTISGMAATGLAPEYTEALGLQSMAITALLSDLTYHELGCYLMKQPTKEERMWLNQYCQAGITAGSLYEEEAFEIQREPNIWRSIKLMKLYRKQKQDQKQAEMQQQYAAEQDKNIQSAQATAQAKMQADQEEIKGKAFLLNQEIQGKYMLENQRASNEAFLLNIKHKLEQNKEITAEEQRRLTEIMKAETVGQYQLAVANARPKPSPTK